MLGARYQHQLFSKANESPHNHPDILPNSFTGDGTVQLAMRHRPVNNVGPIGAVTATLCCVPFLHIPGDHRTQSSAWWHNTLPFAESLRVTIDMYEHQYARSGNGIHVNVSVVFVGIDTVGIMCGRSGCLFSSLTRGRSRVSISKALYTCFWIMDYLKHDICLTGGL